MISLLSGLGYAESPDKNSAPILNTGGNMKDEQLKRVLQRIVKLEKWVDVLAMSVEQLIKNTDPEGHKKYFTNDKENKNDE